VPVGVCVRREGHAGAVGPASALRRCRPIPLGAQPHVRPALLVVVDEAWLFRSVALLVYAGAAAIVFHLFVIGYEERALRRRFGETYAEYRRSVARWIPRPPQPG
jgi:hypothetical protein